MRVAFLIGRSASVLDTAGPWEVFQDVALPDTFAPDKQTFPVPLDEVQTMMAEMPRAYDTFTVSNTNDAVYMTGGMLVHPNYTVDNVPQPDVIVVPGHMATPKTKEWLRAASPKAMLTMSGCTGAVRLAEVGLLDGLRATTHHDQWDFLEKTYPKITLVRNARFVDNGRIATAGGLSSGIDLALHVVRRFDGGDQAELAAKYLEVETRSWAS